MTKQTAIVGALIALTPFAPGCGGSSPAPGAERGHCLPDGSCGAGLICLSDFCVRPSGTDAGGDADVPTRPLVVSAATRTPRATTWSVNYWMWMPAYGDDVTGTDAQVAVLKPAFMRVGGYNNDANTASPFDDAAFDTAVAYAHAIGAEPIIQVPLLADTTGQPPTPATAAAMVRYANVTHAYRVKYFSIGNEPDLYAAQGSLIDPSLPAIPGYTAADYCASATAYVAAMKAVDPTVQIVGPDLSNKYGGGGGPDDWLSAILTGCGDLFDVIAIHRYPFEAEQATAAAAAADQASFRYVMGLVRATLQATGQSSKPLAITEMNVAYDDTLCVLEASPGTVGSALWLADSLGTAMELGLWTSAVWDISDDDKSGLGLIGPAPTHTPRPEYYAYALYAEHFGPTLLSVTTAPSGVSAHASRNAADDATELMISNWNAASAALAFSVTGLATTPGATTFRLPPLSMAAVEIPDTGAPRAWVYGEAQRRSGSAPQSLAPGGAGTVTPNAADGGVAGTGDGGAGRVVGTACGIDGGIVCPKIVLTSPAITTAGVSSASGFTFGTGAWSSYTYAATGEPLPTAAVTADGAGIQIAARFVTPTNGNWEGVGLFFQGAGCVDASAYTGVTFDLAGDLGACALSFGASFSGDLSHADDPIAGACPGNDSQCYGPLAPVSSAAATTIRVPFSALNGGVPIGALDPSTLVDVEWQLSPTAGADGGACSANFTVENVAFY